MSDKKNIDFSAFDNAIKVDDKIDFSSFDDTIKKKDNNIILGGDVSTSLDTEYVLPEIEEFNSDALSQEIFNRYAGKTWVDIDTKGRVDNYWNFQEKMWNVSPEKAQQDIASTISLRQGGDVIDTKFYKPEDIKFPGQKVENQEVPEPLDFSPEPLQADNVFVAQPPRVDVVNDLSNSDELSTATRDFDIKDRVNVLVDHTLLHISNEKQKPVPERNSHELLETFPIWLRGDYGDLRDPNTPERKFNYAGLRNFFDIKRKEYYEFQDKVSNGEIDLTDPEVQIPWTIQEIDKANLAVKEKMSSLQFNDKAFQLAQLNIQQSGIVPPSTAGFLAEKESNEALNLSVEKYELDASNLSNKLNKSLDERVAKGEINYDEAVNIYETEMKALEDRANEAIAVRLSNIDSKYSYNQDEKLKIKEIYKDSYKSVVKQKSINDAKRYASLTGGQKFDAAMEMGWSNVLSTVGWGLKATGVNDASQTLNKDLANFLVEGTEIIQGRNLAEYGAPILEEFSLSSLSNSDWWYYRGASTIPFVLSLIPAGYVGAKVGLAGAGAGGLGTIGTIITGGITGAFASRPIESFMEAGGAYGEQIKSGASEQDALKKFKQVYDDNMTLVGLDALQIGLAVAGLKGVRLPGKLGTTAAVGFQLISEGVEETIQGYFLLEDNKRNGFKSYVDHALSPHGKEEFALGAAMGLGFAVPNIANGIIKDKYIENLAAELLDDGLVEKMSKNRKAFNQAKKDKNKGEQLNLQEKLDARINQIIGTLGELVKNETITQQDANNILRHVAAEAKFKLSLVQDKMNDIATVKQARSVFHSIEMLENQKKELIESNKEANELDVNEQIEAINQEIQEQKQMYLDIIKGRTTAQYVVDGDVLSREEFREFMSKESNLEKVRDGFINVEINTNKEGAAANTFTRDDQTMNILSSVVEGKTSVVDGVKLLNLSTESYQEQQTRKMGIDMVANKLQQEEGIEIITTNNTEEYNNVLDGMNVSQKGGQGVYVGNGIIVIDKSIADIRTVYHERLHPVVEKVIESIGVESFETKLSEFFNTTKEAKSFLDWAKQNYKESDFTKAEQFEEALIEYYAHLTKNKLDAKLNEQRGFYKKLMDFFKNMFTSNKDGMSVSDFQEGMNVFDFLNGVTDEMVNMSVSKPSSRRNTEASKVNANTESRKAFTEDINNALNGNGTFAHMTAENPNNKTQSDELNKQKNEELRLELIERGYNPISVAGMYDRTENSFFVKGMTIVDAIYFGTKYGQESVAHSVGMIYTSGENIGKMEPTTGAIVTDQGMNNYFSTIQLGDGAFKYSIGYDFGNLVNTPVVVQEQQEIEIQGPIKPKGSVIGVRANIDNLRLDNYILAKQMTKENQDPLLIKRQTGWELGKDGQWRYELMPLSLKKDIESIKSGDIVKLTELADLGELTELYGTGDFAGTLQDINKINVLVKKDSYLQEGIVEGSYNGLYATETYQRGIKTFPLPQIILKVGKGSTEEQVRETLIHEVQHYIQDIEYFEGGSNSSSALSDIDNSIAEITREIENSGSITQSEIDSLTERRNRLERQASELDNIRKSDGVNTANYIAYYSNYGEVESRNVEKRLNLTEEQRRNALLDMTEDVQEKSIIFVESSLFTEKLNVKESKLQWSPSMIGRGDRAITERNNIVRDAAEAYYNEEITQEEYLATVNQYSPIKPIIDFIEPAKAEDISTAVGVKSEGKINLQFEEGKSVGLRLDIPAYTNSNIWAITVHEGGTTGAPLSYSNVAKIKNVDFTSNPVVAMNIARHAELKPGGKRMGKATIARMQGEWSPIEGATPQEQGQNAMDFIASIINDDTWSQIGMNPFRHSYFYDRADGMPVLHADEVIQIGGLVYAKNVAKTNPQDKAFEAVEKKTGKTVKFSKITGWKMIHGSDKGLSSSQITSKYDLLKQMQDSSKKFQIQRELWEKAQQEYNERYDKIKNDPMTFEISSDRLHGETASGKAIKYSKDRSKERSYKFNYLPKSIANIQEIDDVTRVTIPRWFFDKSKFDLLNVEGFNPMTGFMKSDFSKDYMEKNKKLPSEFIEDIVIEDIDFKSREPRESKMDMLGDTPQGQPFGLAEVPEGFFERVGYSKPKESKFGGLPIFNLQELDGKLILVVPGDIMGTGVYTGYRDGSNIRVNINGGPLFGNKFKDKNALWASTTEGAFSGFMNMAYKTKDMYMVIVSQGPISHRGNQEFANLYILELEESFQREELTINEAFAFINEKINSTTKTGKKRFPKIHGSTINSIQDLRSLLIDNGTYDVRRDFMDSMGAAGVLEVKNPNAKFETGEYKGFPNISKMLELTLEKSMPLKSENTKNELTKVPRGTIMSVGKIDSQNPRGEQIHPGYPITINGEFLGINTEAGVNISSLMEYALTSEGEQYFEGDTAQRNKKLGGYTKNGALLGAISLRAKESKLPPLQIHMDNISIQDNGFFSFNGTNAKLQFKKNFTTKGLMSKKTYEASIKKLNETKAKMFDVENIVDKFQIAVEKEYGKELDKETLEAINSSLTGTYELVEILPPSIQESIVGMRDYIDSLSQHLIDEGMVQGDLEAVVASNIGVYVNRTYDVFENPNYEVAPEVWNNAVYQLRKSYDEMGIELTENAATEILNEVFAEMKGIGNNPLAFFRAKDLLKRDVKSFKRRKDIPTWMRDVMGESKDPVSNFYKTSSKLIHIIEQSKFLSGLREIGFQEGFLSDKYDSQKFPKRISKEESTKYSQYYPLTQGQALYTTPEFAEVIKMFTSEPNQNGMLMQSLMTANYMFKYGATILSVQTHIRNFLSNTLVVGSFGINPFNINSHKYMFDKLKTDGRWNEAELRKLIQLGVIRDGAYSGELKAIINDTMSEEVPTTKMFTNKAKLVAQGASNIAQKAYQAEDDYWKIFAFYNLKQYYTKAYPNATEEQIDKMTSDDVLNHMPTYSKIPQAIKEIRKFPLVGTFPSFVSEMARNTINHISNTPKMIKSDNEVVSGMGKRRAVGLLTASSLATLIAAAVRNLLPDWDEEKTEALQLEVAPWSRNSDLVPVELEDGSVYYFDFSSLDPYAHIKKSGKTLFNMVSGEEDSVMEFLRETFDPFLGMEPVTEAILEVNSNRDGYGNPIYNETDDPGNIALKGFNHIAKVLTPGTIKSFMKMTDPDKDFTKEFVSTFAGVRVSELNSEKQYYFRVQDAVDDSKLNSRLYFDVANKDDVSDSDKESALQKANTKLQETFETLYNHRKNLETLGMNPKRALKITKMPAEKDIYIGKKNQISMYIGEAFPLMPSHRPVNQSEIQTIANNLLIGASLGIVNGSEIKSIFRKYLINDIQGDAIKLLSTGDYIWDYDMRKVVKKELK